MTKKARKHRACAPDHKCDQWTVRWGKTIVVKCLDEASARNYAKRARGAR